MAERKFNFKLLNTDSNIGSVGDELRKVETQKDFNYQVIPREKIKPNPMNDYPMEDIKKLMESIRKSNRLIHNLLVKPNDNGDYVIISGERRYRAISLGIEEGYPEFDKFKIGLPCSVCDKNISKVDEEILLIIANEETRDEDEARKRRKIKRLYELYDQKNKETGENKSIPKQIANDLGISERQAQRYNSVNNKLIPKLQEAFDNSKITLTKAAQFAAMDEQTQEMIASLLEESNNLTKSEIEAIHEKAKAMEEELRKKIEDISLQALKVEKENAELHNKIAEVEEKLEQQKQLENKIREELKNEYESSNPDQEKIKELEEKIFAMQKDKLIQEQERDRIIKDLRKKESELEQLEKQLKNNANANNSVSDIEKKKIKADVEIKAVTNDIMKQLEQLASISKDYVKTFNEPIHWDKFFEVTSKKLEELQKIAL